MKDPISNLAEEIEDKMRAKESAQSNLASLQSQFITSTDRMQAATQALLGLTEQTETYQASQVCTFFFQ